MTVDEFLAWAEERPGRYELCDGEVVAMSPEQVLHARTKVAVQTALAAAIEAAGLSCEAFPNGLTVRVNERTAYDPDAAVSCGPRLPDEAVELADPVIVVEVLSPSTRRVDATRKLIDYLRLASVHHYLIVDAGHRVVIHHRRGAEIIETRIACEGDLSFDPPGLTLSVADLLPRADS
ncbi:MAG TPA: Uma2 family endonuclease [Beijerinckiaceae bacterium]